MKTYWDKNPGKFRAFFISISVLFLSFIMYQIYKNATTVFTGTDYIALPSNFYIQKNFAGKLINKSKLPQEKLNIDTIRVGSFLIRINNSKPKSLIEIDEIIKRTPNDSIIEMVTLGIFKNSNKFDSDDLKKFPYLYDTFFVKKSNIPENFIREMDKGVFIGYVIKNGATDRAGVFPGDILLTMNDKEIQSDKESGGKSLSQESLRYLRSYSGGDVIIFRILRENKNITINVKLATFGFNVEYFLLLICGLPLIGIGIFFAVKRPYLIASRIAGTFFFLLGCQISLSYYLSSPEFNLLTFFTIILTNIIGIFIIPVLFHSQYYFPFERTSILKKRIFLILPYTISVISSIFFIIWFSIDYKTIPSLYFQLIFISLILFYFVLSFIHSRKETKEQRKMARVARFIVNVSLFIAVGFPMIEQFFPKNFSFFSHYAYFSSFLIPASYFYVTWRYRLLDLKFRIRRNVQYSIFSIIWKISALIIFILMLWTLSNIEIDLPNIKLSGTNIEFVQSPLDPVLNSIYEKIIIIVIAIIFSIFFFKIVRTVQNIIDRKYYRQKFDYKKAQSELTKLFSTRRTIESLAQIIIEKLSELVHLKRVGISFFTDEKNIWEEAIYCYNRKNSEKIYINTPFAIISIVQKFSRTFSVEYFHEGVREFLKKNKFYYAHPVCTSGKCLGVIFIGEKLSETELKDYDIEFLNSVSGNISVAIENIFLLEELTKQERIKHELELARRIQVASLPQKVPNINGLDIAAISIPAQEVGGDFYDFLNGSLNDLTVVVGDVSGKGTSAALYMSKIQGIFQTLHEFRLSPQNLLIRANRLLYKHIDSKSYITAIGANFLTDKCILTFSRAGHLPLLYYNSEKNSIEKLRPNGIGLGLSEEDVFNNSIEEIKIKYLPGDIFLFFSDGITESRNKLGIQFGEDKLIEIFMENKESDSQKICDSIIKSIHLFSSDTSQFDDITLVVVKSI